MEYEPISRLGRGGMGTVDLARDRHGNKVAMKRLTLHGSASEMMQARQRLIREADILRRLDHPSIVRLLDVVEDGDEIILVMPYLPGGNLAERVAQHGTAPPAEVERLAQRLLGALAAAHAAGIIHRDIKPGNVLYDADGEPLLADFGLAYTWDQTAGLTAAGMVVGTPGFIAPEQARGEPLTPASDVFSLGATLRFAATGSGPFGSGDPTLLMVRAADARIERLPRRMPGHLRRRLELMLEPRPDRRPSAAELLNGVIRPRRPSARVVAGSAAVAILVAGVAFAASRDGGGGADAGATGPSLTPETGGPPGDGDPDADERPDDKDCESPIDCPEDPATADDDDRRELHDQLEAVVDGDGDIDTFPIPMADEPGTSCPRQVTLVLRAPEGVELALQVYEGNRVIEEVVADGSMPGRTTFRPTTCEEDYFAVVRATQPLRGDTFYTLTRQDD